MKKSRIITRREFVGKTAAAGRNLLTTDRLLKNTHLLRCAYRYFAAYKNTPYSSWLRTPRAFPF